MQVDEIGHGRAAIEAGATTLPEPVPRLMRFAARVMTGTAYWI
jgi:ubiquinone biosynthesis monooxygenase Coq7